MLLYGAQFQITWKARWMVLIWKRRTLNDCYQNARTLKYMERVWWISRMLGPSMKPSQLSFMITANKTLFLLALTSLYSVFVMLEHVQMSSKSPLHHLSGPFMLDLWHPLKRLTSVCSLLIHRPHIELQMYLFLSSLSHCCLHFMKIYKGKKAQ